MPGKVVRVLVEPGERVHCGQGILVIEAMKMENEIGSPKEGVVKELLASPEDRVEAGASLAVIE
jgi:pyruvate carboxylase subunit B